MAALAGHALEQRQRAIVLGGLFPLLDALVRAQTLLRCGRLDGAALRILQLAHGHWVGARLPPTDPAAPFEFGWSPTRHSADVHQQLVVLRYQGARVPPHGGSAWREVLLAGSCRTERGARLLEWLRIGTFEVRCYDCDAQATGLSARHDHVERGWVPACSHHRTPPKLWGARAMDLGLEAEPTYAPAPEEVSHG